jgi:hypothetical protein
MKGVCTETILRDVDCPGCPCTYTDFDGINREKQLLASASLSVCPSLHPSLRMEQFDSQTGRIFMKYGI